MASTRLVEELSVLMQHPETFYHHVMENSGKKSSRFLSSPSHAYSYNLYVIDPRVKDWLWMQSPIPTLLLCMLYLLCVAVGPKLMKNRKPFDLRYLLIIYNFSLVALSVYIVYQVCLVCVYVYMCVCVCV